MTPSPCSELVKAWAVPWNVPLTVAGNSARAILSMALVTLLSEVPGARLNVIVVDGT